MMNKRNYQNFLREHQDRVFSYALYMLRKREDAEDVTQEVFVKVWRNWDKIDQSKREAWIMRVTYNYCIDMLRKKTGNRKYWISIDQHEYHLNRNPETWHVPDDQCVQDEKQQTFLKAISELPEKTQSMLLLHYYQGYKFHEIGEIMGLSLSSVKTTLHRGRKRLGATLIKHYPDFAGV